MKKYILIIITVLSVPTHAQVETKHFKKGILQNEISEYKVPNKKIIKMPHLV